MKNEQQAAVTRVLLSGPGASPGVPAPPLLLAANTQSLSRENASEASPTWGIFVVFKNFPDLLK